MKKLVVVALGLMMAASASASQMLVKVLQESDPIASNVIKEVPIKSCRMEQVPIYGTTSGSAAKPSVADKAAGAIFGGLLGSQLGSGDGKDAATFLGAIIGAEMVDGQVGQQKQQVITGYREQEVCEMIVQQSTVQEVTSYKTYIEFGGQIWQLNTPISYAKGDFIKVSVDITMAN
ncbi:MAG: glycine zipper 2TM domain-containing protein [Gammaproteobacteria bacterium]|nr:glycine zipper 2TM domain-containing protein [Gammaproteobacteria bacterium]